MRLKVKDPLAVLPYLAPGSGSPPPPDPEEIFSDAFGLADNWQYPYGTPPTPSPAPGSWLSSLEIHGTSGLLYPCGCTLTYQDGTQVTQGHAPADSDGSAAFSGGSPVSGLEFSTVNVTVAESVDSNSGWVPRLESYVSSVQFGPFDPVSLSVHSLVKTSPPTSKGILGTSFSPTEYPGAVAGHPILQYAMVSYDGYILSSVHVWMGSQRWNDDGFGSTWIFGFRRADSKF